MAYQTIELVKEGNFATLYLNRVNSLNAMDVEMLKELRECLADVATSDVKLLLVTGRGRAFSAGGDIKTMLTNEDDSSFQSVMDNIKNIIISLYTMPAVTVSFLNGAAAGLGLSFALACDQVFAEKNAKIAMNFINIGLIPDGGGHFFLKKRLGEHKAKQVIWEGKSMTCDEALKTGIVDSAYEGDTEKQLELVKRELETRPLKAMIASKMIYSEQEKQLLIETLDLETKKQLEMRRTQDHREGISAFLEKRPAHFMGN